MRQARAWWKRVTALFGRESRDAELAQEIESHLQMHIDDNLERGMSPEEARRQALLKLGGVEPLKEAYRDRRGVPWLEHFVQDVRYGLRVLLKNPGFTLAAVLALALGIGANTALFSAVYGVLLSPLPYADGNHLVLVRQGLPAEHIEDMSASATEIADYRAQSKTLDAVEEYHSMQFILLGRQPDNVTTGVVSAGFFPMLGVKPLLGRVFQPSDDVIDAPPVLVLSYPYWKRAFGGDPNIVGKTFKMNDRMHTVVGVLPPIPQYPRENDVYMPISSCPFRSNATHRTNRAMRMMSVFGHVKPGVSMAAASAEIHALGARFQRDFPDDYPDDEQMDVTVRTLRDQLTSGARTMLLLLLGTTGMVLLICCTNVANLALARMVRRESEFAVRMALGASRGRLVRQLLTESTLLAVVGGALGLLLAWFSLGLLVKFVARFSTRAYEVHLSPPVLVFTFGLSVVTGLLFGSLPAFTAGRAPGAMKAGSNTSTAKVHGQRMRAGLMIAEMALSFVLLTAAGLMIRTLSRLQKVDAGYDADHVVTMRLPGNFTKYDKDDKIRLFDDEVLRRVGAMPGVISAGMSSAVPLGAIQFRNGITGLKIEGRQTPPALAKAKVTVSQASPNAFQTLGIPLFRGRVFNDSDRPEHPLVIILSRSTALHYFGDEDPIGHRVSDDGKEWFTIVGVVGDVREFALDKAPVDTAYLSLAQYPGAPSLSIRTHSDPMSMAALAGKTIQGFDPEQPVTDIKTLDEVRGDSLLNTRVATWLLGIFAAVALAIAATGLAGVTAFLVSQRTREIGIRLALGAQVQQVLAMVLSHGVKLIAIGAGTGLLLSLATTRLLQPLLFEVQPVDWPTMLAVAVVLAGVSIGASYVPARRATRVDPMVALRCD